MILILDYNTGNLRSVAAACRAVGLAAVVSSDPEDIWRASAMILPGVGAFGPAMKRLATLGLVEHVRAFAQSRPVLGICLGMQLMMDGSEEHGGAEGLGLVAGDVRRLPDGPDPIPHVGRREVKACLNTPWSGSPLETTSPGSSFYFCHSYYCDLADEWPIAVMPFGKDGLHFAAAIRRGQTFGVQFHPEKSGEAGLRVFRQFRAMVEGVAA